MNIADEIIRAKNDLDEVYEAGNKSEYDRFWDNYQDKGTRTSYQYAFAGYGWKTDTFKPKYDVKPINASNLFSFCGRVNLIEAFSKAGVTLDTSNTNAVTYLAQSSFVSHFPTLDLRNVANLSYLFYNNTALVEIEKIILKDDGSQIFSIYSFSENPALKEIRFEGIIGSNGISFQQSTSLSHDSITSIINALSTTTSGLSVTFSKEAVNTAFGINVDDTTTYPEGSEYHTLRHSKDNWTINYM